MEQAHEQPPASLAPGSDSLKGTKEAKEVKEAKEAVETKCAKPEGKSEGKPEGGAQGDKSLDLEAGMATAEYAIGTVAAAAFAGLLLAIIRSGGLRPMIESLLSSALSVS
mgnify:CR=1 FL=1|jgi:hypothetical protein avisC_06934